MRWKEGLSPNTPWSDEGIRIEPPPSEPSPTGAIPSAIAAPVPVDEPPGARFGWCALRGMWKFGLMPTGLMPHSVVWVLPGMTAPPEVRARTANPSSS